MLEVENEEIIYNPYNDNNKEITLKSIKNYPVKFSLYCLYRDNLLEI